MKQNKHWFNGVKWAEEQIRQHGLRGFMQDFIMDNLMDTDAFDRGADACIDHYIELEKKGLYCETVK